MANAVLPPIVGCKDSSGTIINDIHLLKLSFDFIAIAILIAAAAAIEAVPRAAGGPIPLAAIAAWGAAVLLAAMPLVATANSVAAASYT